MGNLALDFDRLEEERTRVMIMNVFSGGSDVLDIVSYTTPSVCLRQCGRFFGWLSKEFWLLFLVFRGQKSTLRKSKQVKTTSIYLTDRQA